MLVQQKSKKHITLTGFGYGIVRFDEAKDLSRFPEFA